MTKYSMSIIWTRVILGLFFKFFVCVKADGSLWSIWWRYEGFSGPTMWGTMTPEWYMCSKGKNQSPIDIEPNQLLFDPSLKHLQIDGDKVSGTLVNYGYDLTFEFNDTSSFGPLNISQGPFSYKYRAMQLKVHFGLQDGYGSEHSVHGQFFDGEIQILAYNSDVYGNFSQAQKSPRGIAIIAAFLQVGNVRNEEFDVITNLSRLVLYKGQRVRLKQLRLSSLLPNVNNFITYDGSLTQPGCQETVTWLVLNKPIQVSYDQMNTLRNLKQWDINYPTALMADNRRPIMPLNRRTLRTNINFTKGCSMEKDMEYQSDGSLWSIWWRYEGFSGPTMWGTMTPEWYMCSKGKNQSPIDIESNQLLFDPSLKHLQIDGDKVSGTLVNYGYDLTFEFNDTSSFGPLNISQGPFSYKYRAMQLKVHFGLQDGYGSEHSVHGQFFHGEIQILAYNSDVYSNFSQAQKSPRGIAIIAAFLQVGNVRNEEFDVITNLSRLVLYKGQRVRLKQLRLSSLLPNVNNFITYDGSLTQPGCQETVTWLVLNKLIQVSYDQMNTLRNLKQWDINYPTALMADNRRPIMPLNRRTLRTNINFTKGCSIEQNMEYQLKTRLRVKK